MINVDLEQRYRDLKLGGLLRKAAEAALQHEGRDTKAELTIVVSGDAKLKELNTKFMGQAKPTDVLSFPADEPAYLGDIAISLPRARAQAKAAGHSLHWELQLLAVHGVLHLLGHDHARPADKARMWQAQAEILASLGVSIDLPTSPS